MFSKLINFFTKSTFFRKLYFMTMGIVLFILLSSFLINFFFLDKFYIHQKKQDILRIKNNILRNLNDFDKLEEYIDFAEDNYGVKISVDFNACSQKKHRKKMTLDVGDYNFRVKNSESSQVTFITLTYRYDANTLLTIRTSLAVIDQYVDNILIFNIITAILTLIISGFIISYITKKINSNIEYLKTQAKSIERMEYPTEISLKSGDELEELASSLNMMSKQLHISTDNLKSFVSNASHELKTPISILCLYSQALVLDKVSEEKKREYFKVMLDKSLEMKNLTEGLLMLSKINSPTYKLNMEEIELKSLIIDGLANYDYLEFEKNLEIDTQIEELTIGGDRTLIKIAINNLIQNMLKYSKIDSTPIIVLNKDKLLFKNPTNSLDTNSILEPFKRGENALNDRVEGSGLGLSLVKRILELHNLKFEIYVEKIEELEYFNFIIYF